MNQPIVIGGVGGSGTRICVELIEQCGYDFGRDLNSAHDHLWFNYLFYRPNWLIERLDCQHPDIQLGLDLVEKHFHASNLPTLSEIRFIAKAFPDFVRKDNFGARWAAKRVLHALQPRTSVQKRWGWKEPLSHLLIEDILDHFPTARYIHVIRHGLDMTYSKNMNQARKFGRLFNLPSPTNDEVTPDLALDYWLAANQRALETMRCFAPERTLCLNFDQLCLNPAAEAERILSFLQVESSPDLLQRMVSIPKPPASMGRYQNHNWQSLGDQRLEQVAQLGFSL